MKNFNDLVELHLKGFPSPVHDSLRKFASSLGGDLIKAAQEDLKEKLVNFLSMGSQMQKGSLADVSPVDFEKKPEASEDDRAEDDSPEEGDTEGEEEVASEDGEPKKKRGRPPKALPPAKPVEHEAKKQVKKQGSIVCRNLECDSGRPGVKPFGGFCAVCKDSLSESQKKKKKDEFLAAREKEKARDAA